MADGRPCGATRRRAVPFCFLHDPASTEEQTEARRLGGLRRRRERTLAAAYEVSGVGTLEEQLRLLEIGAFEALALPNSLARVRLLLETVRTGLKVRAAAGPEAHVAALEAALIRPRAHEPASSLLGDAERFGESDS